MKTNKNLFSRDYHCSDNRILPVPQIFVNEISVNIHPYANYQSFNNNPLYLTPFNDKRSRSFSPNPSFLDNSSLNQRSMIKPPSSPSSRIEVKTPKCQFSKRRAWLLEQRNEIKDKTFKIKEKIEELAFLKARNQFVKKEMKCLELKRNKNALFTKLKIDNKVLNGLLFELIMENDKIASKSLLYQIKPSSIQNSFYEEPKPAIFFREKKGLQYRKLELLKGDNERLLKGLDIIKNMFIQLKFFERLTVINVAIQREGYKRKKLSFK